MLLYVKAKTNIKDVMIDYIELELKDGTEVSMDWDESQISRNGEGFDSEYRGIYINEEYANGRIRELEGCKILDFRLYSEDDKLENPYFIVESMVFDDNGEVFEIETSKLVGLNVII